MTAAGPAGVAITGVPPGATPYEADLADGAPVSLLAPTLGAADVFTYQFAYWLLNGEPQAVGQSTLAFTLHGDATAVAVYTRVPLPGALIRIR